MYITGSFIHLVDLLMNSQALLLHADFIYLFLI